MSDTIYCANDPCEAEARVITGRGVPMCRCCAQAFEWGMNGPTEILEIRDAPERIQRNDDGTYTIRRDVEMGYAFHAGDSIVASTMYVSIPFDTPAGQVESAGRKAALAELKKDGPGLDVAGTWLYAIPDEDYYEQIYGSAEECDVCGECAEVVGEDEDGNKMCRTCYDEFYGDEENDESGETDE